MVDMDGQYPAIIMYEVVYSANRIKFWFLNAIKNGNSKITLYNTQYAATVFCKSFRLYLRL